MYHHPFSPPVAVGVDVAKATLSVCIRSRDGNERALTLRNIETDINRKLVPLMTKYTGKVVMESTGHYHWTTALLLRQAGIDVRVVNPLLAKQYTTGNIRKVKTDPADASGLARIPVLCPTVALCEGGKAGIQQPLRHFCVYCRNQKGLIL